MTYIKSNFFVNSDGRITSAIVGFCQFLRDNGLNVGIQETFDSLEAAKIGTLKNKHIFKFTLRALLCSSKEEFDQFNSLFDVYWGQGLRKNYESSAKRLSQTDTVNQRGKSLFMIGKRANSTVEEGGKSVTGASAQERLRKTDFSKLQQSDLAQLEELAHLLWKQMSMRLTRRLKTSNKKHQVNLRRTIRRSIHYGGNPIELSYKGRKLRRPRLVVLLDVSGSMDQYSFFLLKFIYALQKNFERVESFLFSTRLICITEVLKKSKMDETLKSLSNEAETWSSGTKIGECFREFNLNYAKRVLSRNSLVIILSDGLDTGEPEALKTELKQIKRRTKKLIWLNPLIGMEEFQPLTRGISAALPIIDVFISAHNLESLLQLERYIVNV